MSNLLISIQSFCLALSHIYLVFLCHFRSSLTITPRSLVSDNVPICVPSENSKLGGKSHFLDFVKLIILVFCLLITNLFLSAKSSACSIVISYFPLVKGVVSCFDITAVLPDHAKIHIKLLCSWCIFGFSVRWDTKGVARIFWL